MKKLILAIAISAGVFALAGANVHVNAQSTGTDGAPITTGTDGGCTQCPGGGDEKGGKEGAHHHGGKKDHQPAPTPAQ